MPRAVVDSTALVSAFLARHGVSDALLRHGRRGAFTLCLSEAILNETRRVLVEYERIRRRYPYADDDIDAFVASLRSAASLAHHLPLLQGVSRGPNDDVIIATALAASAQYLVTRDNDLLALGTYEGVRMVTPEAFMEILRRQAPFE
jgi:putative PIN family toxin of toxin-antitoxin system